MKNVQYTPWNKQFTPANNRLSQREFHLPTIDFQGLGHVSCREGTNCIWKANLGCIPAAQFGQNEDWEENFETTNEQNYYYLAGNVVSRD